MGAFFKPSTHACMLLTAALVCGGAMAQSAQRYDERWVGETASELNKSLPKQIDPETRWDRVTAGPGTRLTYTYTLVRKDAASVDLEKFNAEMLALLRKSACGRESMRDLVQSGVRLAYTYRGSDGRFISLIELGNRPCGPV